MRLHAAIAVRVRIVAADRGLGEALTGVSAADVMEALVCRVEPTAPEKDGRTPGPA